jgi:HK97 family phage prohead protease
MLWQWKNYHLTEVAQMQLTFSSNIECDQGRRIISGKIVPYDGEIGQTSVGKVVFEQGSIQLPEPGKSKLLLEHDLKKPLGKAVAFNETPLGVFASFKVSNTSRGTDALIEASDGLRSGLSVGVEVLASEPRDGVLYVQSARLFETSLVQAAAFDSAAVTSVAASAAETEDEALTEITQSESEAILDTTPDTVAPEAVVETPAVEASRPTVTAAFYTAPRVNLNVTAGQVAKAQLAASRGDNDARDLIAALEVATVAENTGMVPPNYLRDVIGIIDSSRPFIDSIERAALPAAGMKIFTPKLGTQATVALTAEGAEFDSTDTTVTFQEDNVVKFAGAGRLDVELVDRSDPSFLDLYIRELAASYAQKTDAYAAKIAADGADSSTGTTIYKSIADGIADSYNVMRFTPNRLMVAPSGGYVNIDYANLLGAVDGSGRPLFAAAAVQNAAGLISQGSTQGTVAGLSLVVDPNYTGNTGNAKVALVYPSAAMRFHESPQIQLRTAVVANGQLDIGLYGYVAVVNRYPTAFRKLDIA